jgi:peptidoglycan/LPS O-acetylase OafA/YrhL
LTGEVSGAARAASGAEREERPATKHFAWFDCLRCAAIFLVLLAHCGPLPAAVPASWAPLVSGAQQMSWAGVDLFFVLSGFLVSGLLFAEHDQTGRIEISRFLVRRAFKIIPPFYVLILVTVVYNRIFVGRIDLNHLLHDVLFLQSYRAGFWSHAWTLAIEVHFYLLLALLLYGLSRAARGAEWLRPLPAILGGVLAACFLARLITAALSHGAFNYHRELEPSHLHLDVLAAGVLLRYLYNYHGEVLRFLQRARALWIGLGLLLVYPSREVWTPHPPLVIALIPTCNYLGFGLILFEAAQIAIPSTVILRALIAPFDYLGKHSYSIYLWHLPVKAWLVDPFIKDRGPLYFSSFFLGSLVVGTLFSVALEMPVLRLRNHFFPSVTRRS